LFWPRSNSECFYFNQNWNGYLFCFMFFECHRVMKVLVFSNIFGRFFFSFCSQLMTNAMFDTRTEMGGF
jgi:hypothetical protein